MMKLKGKFGGRPVVVFGLSHANLDRLRKDGLSGCICVPAEEMDLPFDIIITAAPHERDFMDAFSDGITEDTVLKISSKLKT